MTISPDFNVMQQKLSESEALALQAFYLFAKENGMTPSLALRVFKGLFKYKEEVAALKEYFDLRRKFQEAERSDGFLSIRHVEALRDCVAFAERYQ